MTETIVGGRRYRIVTARRDADWIAHAEHADTGERFGIECAAVTEHAVVDRIMRWLEWQHEHAVALEALQQAERSFHRSVAGSAFVSPTEGPSAIELQKESLDAVEAARLRLDEVRARRPE